MEYEVFFPEDRERITALHKLAGEIRGEMILEMIRSLPWPPGQKLQLLNDIIQHYTVH